MGELVKCQRLYAVVVVEEEAFSFGAFLILAARLNNAAFDLSSGMVESVNCEVLDTEKRTFTWCLVGLLVMLNLLSLALGEKVTESCASSTFISGVVGWTIIGGSFLCLKYVSKTLKFSSFGGDSRDFLFCL